jgi:serine/threonine protein kinase
MSEGLTLAGRYRLVTKLGQGGMGSVWRAVHLTLGTPVAIKLIDPSIAQSEEALARFKREAQAAAELKSAHVVHVTDYGIENGTPYIAMELLEGESLADRISHLGRLTPSDTATILSQVARALNKAHQQNIIHRDLKPENIFIVRDGDDELVKVLDFGIAKKMGLTSSSGGIKTHTGAMLGTPYYMSPEQAKGKATVDQRADIWSFGIIAYECITGARPFENETLASLLVAICTEPLPVPSEVAPVPKGFDDWFARAASRDLEFRFQSASAAAARLREVCGIASAPHTLDVTERSAVAPKRDAVTALGITAEPASITINGMKRAGLRKFGLAAASVLLLGIVGVLLGRMLTKHEGQNTNATASQSQLSPAVSLLPAQTPRIVPSAADPVAVTHESASPSAAASNSHPDRAAEATNAGRPSGTRAAVPKGGKPTTSSSDTPTLPAASSDKKPLVNGNTSTRRDYDKSVGF